MFNIQPAQGLGFGGSKQIALGLGTPFTITEDVVEQAQGSGLAAFLRRRPYVKGTYEVYKELRKAREKVEEDGITARALKMREKKLVLAEAEVEKLLNLQVGEVTGEVVEPQVLGEFVGALRFSPDLGEMPDQDLEEVILILLIDELTDD